MSQSGQSKTGTTLGIVTGSGPEAGIDLWAKVLRANKAAMGDAFRGDLDAPRVIVVSEPELGLSMDLRANDAEVWAAMQRALAVLAPQVDAYAIACNTLNWYAPRIEALALPARLLSFQSVLTDWITAQGVTKLALLGAGPVTEMGEWSAYRFLRELVEVELPADPAALHALIHDVKRLGGDDPSLPLRLQALVEGLEADVVLLACTELPLIARFDSAKQLVDVTDLVAEAMVARVHGEVTA
ncbi:aspartate/glutamate racemase family protein [Pararhodobacter sp. CCB-MM2]|uniref:aspartate/glutamate racemase family protein n=1 Tax=Pararhodobacter sp. CCB-MM2 TaxID=1786003 RepID=UPI0008378C68|nr:aspartate/glutamate racemase family protein [Pararhodobacter sp. CCB-MM2]